MLDFVVRGGKVIDGTGCGWFYADVLVKDGYIEHVCRGHKRPEYWRERAAHVIDAAGKYVLPGFIDIHTHSDRSLLSNPNAKSALLQGVTTECTGMCGISVFPQNPGYESLEDFRNVLMKERIAINVAPFVGHGTLRAKVMGKEGQGGERFFPQEQQMRQMEELLAQALDEGAFGISTGLIYPPGRNAAPAEVVRLARVAARSGGVHCCHLRSEEDMLIEAVEELTRITSESGAPASISHHKAMFRRNWGKPCETLRMIESAREDGIELVCDFYPWTISAVSLLIDKIVPLLDYVADPGLLQKPKERAALSVLEDDSTWQSAKQILVEQSGNERAQNECRSRALLPHGAVTRKSRDLEYWEVVAFSPSRPEFFGLTYKEIADTLGEEDHWDAMRRVCLLDEGLTRVGAGPMSEHDILAILGSANSIVSSDSSVTDGSSALHPRVYANFSQALSWFIKQKNAISLERLVQKCTSMPAGFAGIEGRGCIKKGFYADVTVLDWERFASHADFAEPAKHPSGVEHVLVNGRLAVEDGKCTAVRAGQVLSRM